MPVPRYLLPHTLGLDPDADLMAQTRALPARHAVALLLADNNHPLQMLAGKDLRALVRRRLQTPEAATPSRRTDYRRLLKQVIWRPVDSPFEEDWIFASAARMAFPDTWRDIVRLPEAWYIHLDPSAPFPRWSRVAAGQATSGVRLGPIPEKRLADQLIETIEDVFDLCRYHHILTQAPHGKACAYKDMQRCPAPCDGTVPVQLYRQRIADSATALLDLDTTMRECQQQMQQAAAALAFEQAATLKRRFDALSRLKDKRYRSLHLGESAAVLILAPGPQAGSAKLFLWRNTSVHQILSLLGPADDDVVVSIRAAAGPHPLPELESATESPEIPAALLCRTLLRKAPAEVCLPIEQLSLRLLNQQLKVMGCNSTISQAPQDSENDG